MYFLGLVKYTSSVSLFHVMPLDLLASVYAYPAPCPVCLPISPLRLGPVLCLPPASTVWHCAQRWTKIFFPFSVILMVYLVGVVKLTALGAL